jgi:hypothetical protein
VEKGANIAIVGPSGSGTSSVIDLLFKKLQTKNPYAACLDCRSRGSWQDKFRDLCEGVLEKSPNPSDSPVLIIDHINDLTPDQIVQLHSTVVNWKGKSRIVQQQGVQERSSLWRILFPWITNCFPSQPAHPIFTESIQFKSLVWAGNLDCRNLEDSIGLRIASEPCYVLETTEYNAEHLLLIYAAIGAHQESQWGEAIQYTLLDWCGTDLALASSLGSQFYGNWRDFPLYDDVVADCIGRWLKTDPLVEEYRQLISCLPAPCMKLINTLNSGGKIPSHSPHFSLEPNESIRHLFTKGVISTNLLPGFYQYRNLTMRLLALQNDNNVLPVEPFDLLRKFSNGRNAAVLQDVEISLRMLAQRCFKHMGYETVKDKLQKTRTDDQAMSKELRISLLDWAKQKDEDQRHHALNKHLAQYTKDFEAAKNLWSRIRELYSHSRGEPLKEDEPLPLEKATDYMTFNELANLILSLGDVAFPRFLTSAAGKDAPAKRWPAHLSLIRRLRNQSAHLRNFALQDTEDLLVAVREIRKDIEKYA